ncbi:exophilin-5 isoform X2 [Hyperolius riggenbachi]|uniref:exophilin-5 isoform X2 n=1 Tax=Hyperolius riggenbachi TaxID=752182 RepID=UPI0035A2DB43
MAYPGDSESFRMSSPRTFQSQKNSGSGSAFMRIRSPFSSLFSFRKPKQEAKSPTQQERHSIFSTFHRPTPSTEPVKKKFEIYQSGRSVKQIASFFEAQQKRTNDKIPSNKQLEREAFQVLGDLDQTLAQEQSHSNTLRSSRVLTYRHGNIYNTESSRHNVPNPRKDYNTLTAHDGRRTTLLGENHSSHATYQPRRFYEMYTVRHRSRSQPETDSIDFNARNCPTLTSKRPTSAPCQGTFTSSSLELPSMSIGLERNRQQKPRRTPISSIRWSSASSSDELEVPKRPYRTHSALDLTNIDKSPQQSRIFELYKYNKPHRGLSAGINDAHKHNYPNDLTSRRFHNNVGDRLSQSYKTDSSVTRPVRRFQAYTESHREKDNTDLVTTRASSVSGVNKDKEIEPMEIEKESPSVDNGISECKFQNNTKAFIVESNVTDPHSLNLQTADSSTNMDTMKVDHITKEAVHESSTRQNLYADLQHVPSEITNNIQEHGKISQSGQLEADLMEVDVPKDSELPTATFLSGAKEIAVGHHDQKDTFAPSDFNQDLSTIESQGSDHSPALDQSNKNNYHPRSVPTANSTPPRRSSSLFGKLVRLTLRRGAKDDTGGFRSDMLKHQKKYVCSLPNLIDQGHDQLNSTNEKCSVNDGAEKTVATNSTSVFKTEPTKVTAGTHEICSESHSGSQNNASQTSDSYQISLEGLQKPYTYLSGPVPDSTCTENDKKTTWLEKTSHSTSSITETDGAKESFTEAAPTYLDVYSKYRSMYFNGGPHKNAVQTGADTNNNRQFTKGLQTPEELRQADGLKTHFTHTKTESWKPENVKDLKNKIFTKPSLFANYEKYPLSAVDQENLSKKTEAKQHFESKKNINQSSFHHLEHQTTNTVPVASEEPQVQTSTVEERLQRNVSSNINTEKVPQNVFKKQPVITESFEEKASSKEDTVSPWMYSTYSKDDQVQSIYTCESLSTSITSNVTTEVKETLKTEKTYTCQRITEKTQIYETSYRDSSQPDVDKIEYHKVVSVFYTLPRNSSKRLSDVTQNNLKNIDNTLENSRAPSALLDRIINRNQKSEEKYDFGYENMGGTSPLHYTTKPMSLVDELDSVERSPGKQHFSNFNLNPLETNLMDNESLPGEEPAPLDFDFVDKMNSLHISESNVGHKGNETSHMQKSTTNKNEYSPTRTSPWYTQNTYYTLPNKKSSLQDLEKSLLENDIARARDRYNLYPNRGNMAPTTSESQDIFLSPTFGYDNLNVTPAYDATYFPETNKQGSNINNLMKTDDLCKEPSLDDSVFYREDIPSVYRSKGSNNVNKHESYRRRDISPGAECNLSPQLYNQTNVSKVNEASNRTRPAYCSEYVQKKMKPINAKKFTYSFDNTGQQEELKNSRSSGSNSDSLRKSDVDSPSVLCSPNDNRRYYGLGRNSLETSNLYRSKSLKILNNDNQSEAEEARRRSDGSFSSKSCGGHLKSRNPLVYGNSGGTICNRTHSAEMIIDENDNWPSSKVGQDRKPAYTSKSVDYGIFGKEQQEALLNNVRRTLTEGRLWRPSFLKNPGFLNKEEHCTSQESHQTGCKPDDDGLKKSLNIYEAEVPPNSDPETDTTTDDEYYLDDDDKESEL